MGVPVRVPDDGEKAWGWAYLLILNPGSPVPLRMLLRQWTLKEPGADAVKAFRGTLRSLVDRWIDSAKNDSEERPLHRIIALEPLNALIQRHPPHLEYRHTKADPNQLRFSMWPLGFQPGDDSVTASQDAAGYLFLELLRSPEASRLSRCDFCRKYFVRERKPKRYTVIYNGSFCPKHRGKSRSKSTKAIRDDRKNKIIKLAVDVWEKWNPNQPHRYGERAVWIAEQINKRLPGKWHIKRNWITGHIKDIEAEVDRRKGRTHGERKG